MTTTDFEARLAAMEQRDALLTDGLRRVIEGHWTGADGAAGLVVALMGGQAPAGFAPIPCPKDDTGQ